MFLEKISTTSQGFASQWLHSFHKRPPGASPSLFETTASFVEKKVFIINLLSVTRKPEKAQRFHHLKGVNEWLWYLKGKEKTPFYRSEAKKKKICCCWCASGHRMLCFYVFCSRENALVAVSKSKKWKYLGKRLLRSAREIYFHCR